MTSAEGALTPEKVRRTADERAPIRGWHLRPAAQNDAALRGAFCSVLEASAVLPPDQRLIMYDAEDGGAITQLLSGPLRKRLDARRNSESPALAPLLLSLSRVLAWPCSLLLSSPRPLPPSLTWL
jgi:hypothetical protein